LLDYIIINKSVLHETYNNIKMSPEATNENGKNKQQGVILIKQ
jgi:hypothetical protein